MTLIHLPITKVDESQRLVYGVMAKQEPDKSREVFDYAASRPHIEKWSETAFEASGGKSRGNVRGMHGKVAAGLLTDIAFDDDRQQVECCAKIVDDAEWQKVAAGVYTGFSIGGRYGERRVEKDSGLTYYEAIPSEVSLVDNPCIPSARFTLVKADGTEAEVEFVKREGGDGGSAGGDAPDLRDLVKQVWTASDGKTFEKKADALTHEEGLAKAAKAASDPAAKLEAALDGLRKAVDGQPSGGTGTEAQYPKVGDLAKIPVNGQAKTVAVTKVSGEGLVEFSDGSTADWAKTYPTFSVTHVDNDRVWSAAQAGKADDGDLKKDDGSKPYGDVKYADPGYQDDKKARYPVDTEGHIRAGWNYIHKAKNAGKYSSEQLSKIKGAIASAWKAKIDASGPPSLDKLDAGSLQKGLGAVCSLANLLEQLVWLQKGLEMEAEVEGDGSDEPAKLKEQIAGLVACLKALVQEETDELFSPDELVDLMETLERAERPAGIDALAKAVKGHGDVLAKVGARHSKEDLGHLQAMHDHSVAMGAKCDGSNPSAALNRADAGGELAKLAGENAQLRETLEKAVGQVDELRAKVEEVLAQPAQPRPVKGRVVEKADDGLMGMTPSEVIAAADPDLLATTMIKLAQAQGRTLAIRGGN